jgi:hypothetical protein
MAQTTDWIVLAVTALTGARQVHSLHSSFGVGSHDFCGRAYP